MIIQMSRFDRRLKPELVNRNVGVMSSGIRQEQRKQIQPSKINIVRSSSPRPGIADCKIRTTSNNQMLGKSLFMGDSVNLNKPSIQVIESSYEPIENNENQSFSQDVILEDISKKNKLISERIKKTRDPNMRLLFGHEIRLNTIEGAVDCLNQIKCNEVLDNQKEIEKSTQMNDILNTIDYSR